MRKHNTFDELFQAALLSYHNKQIDLIWEAQQRLQIMSLNLKSGETTQAKDTRMQDAAATLTKKYSKRKVSPPKHPRVAKRNRSLAMKKSWRKRKAAAKQ